MSETNIQQHKNEVDNKVQSKANIYAEGNVFKTLLVTSLPVLVLMLTNTLYQMVDSAIAANLVTYGNGLLTGSIVTMMAMPVILIMMAAISLTNMGFGTLYAQKLGQKDEQGAKKAISTMHLTNIIIISIGMLISFVMVGPWLNFMGIDLKSIGNIKVDGGTMTLYTDALLTMFLYALVVGFSSFQGIISRQLRSEGHIKAAAYLPLISIPFNIILDLIFMGPLSMGASGAALASLLASSLTTISVITYTMYISRKGETYFSWSVFKLGVDWKLFLIMCAIGIGPFVLQIGRAYSQIMSIYLTRQIGSVGMIQLLSSISRPMLLILMPAFAIIQTAAAMIGYNFGAKNHERVSKTIWSSFGLLVIFALPQYIIIMIWPDFMYSLFGAKEFVYDGPSQWINISYGEGSINLMSNINRHEANIAYWSYLGLSIIQMLPVVMVVYYLSTRRIGYAIVHIVIQQFIIFTIVILAFYFTIGTNTTSEVVYQFIIDPNNHELIPNGTVSIEYNPNIHLYYIYVPTWALLSQVFLWPIFTIVRYRDNKIMDEYKIDAEHQE